MSVLVAMRALLEGPRLALAVALCYVSRPCSALIRTRRPWSPSTCTAATSTPPWRRCRCRAKRAAELFAEMRARGVPIVHVVTEYRDPTEIAANPFRKWVHDEPTPARRG